MITATRRWFRRNRTKFAVGAGTLGLAYSAGQYAWSKWLEARQRMSEERIAKENLRRRFEQNQEDCTYTVSALSPTVRDEIISALPVEEITTELQKQKSERLARSVGTSEVASTDLPSGPPSTIDDDRASSGSFQTGSYVHASQMAESSQGAGEGQTRPKKSKAQSWYDMKIGSITRALTLLYTLSLLTLLTRIQLNLLGRRTYLSSVVSLASPPAGIKASTISSENNDDDNFDNVYGTDFETNRKYLTFSWWLLHRGCKEIMEKVQTAVKEVFGPLNPREDISLERSGELILEVRKKVEGATETERREHKWLPYLLPPKEQEELVLRESDMSADVTSPLPQSDLLDKKASTASVGLNPSLRRSLDETSDLIDSPTFTHVSTLLLNTAFSHLIDSRIASEAFKLPTSSPNDLFPQRITDSTEISERKCKLAQTSAVFCRQAHVIAAGSGETDELVGPAQGIQNEYSAAIDHVKDSEGFAAVIYSSNFEFEAVEEMEKGDVRPPRATQPRTQDEERQAEGEPLPTVQPVGESEGRAELPQEVLGENEVVLGNAVEVAAKGEEETKPTENEMTGFDSAWEKASAKEDGIKKDDA